MDNVATMAIAATGSLEPMGPSIMVRFVRAVAAPPAKVWAALTDPAQLEGWLAPAEFTAQVGARISLGWPGPAPTTGEVLECVANETLEYSLDLPQERTMLRIELEGRDGATSLRLTHSGTSAEDAPGFGAGWQSRLEALDAVLAGGTSSPQDRDARGRALLPAYEALLAKYS